MHNVVQHSGIAALHDLCSCTNGMNSHVECRSQRAHLCQDSSIANAVICS